MPQVSAQLSAELIDIMDAAARRLHRSRAELIRQAVELYLTDLEDLRLGLERQQDTADPVLDWEDAKRELLGQDQG
ncbi:MAG: ribbon-helix-helix protein, CopG family [Thermoanaerobaculia bacterium]|nr:ribbon-helix-helix protein, CopG family [Thermoanaerobaculia bacterium]